MSIKEKELNIQNLKMNHQGPTIFQYNTIRNTGDGNLTNSVANNAKTRGHWIAYNENI